MMSNEMVVLVLNAIAGFGNKTIQKMIGFYGDLTGIFSRNAFLLEEDSVLNKAQIENLRQFDPQKFLDEELRSIERHQAKVITVLDTAYPEILKNIDDAPVVLYVKGALPSADDLSVAIVGSRKSSLYGISIAEKFSRELSELGFVIVSGMARGVDTAAHKAALKAKARTVAVLGSGLANIYPKENAGLVEQIAQSGAVISEFPMHTSPLAHNFPRRNRIISGLSQGVIVVEAAKKSGALITADFALEQGKEIFAVPGRIDTVYSQGTHGLIQQGAKLVTCVEDVLQELSFSESQLPPVAVNRVEKCLAETLADEERQIVQQIGTTPVHIDELAGAFSNRAALGKILLNLELKKVIKQLPGKVFVVNRSG